MELTNCEINYLDEIAKVANILSDKLGCDGINLENNCGTAAGQEVFHVHFHLIPRYKDLSINEKRKDFEQVLSKITK